MMLLVGRLRHSHGWQWPELSSLALPWSLLIWSVQLNGVHEALRTKERLWSIQIAGSSTRYRLARDYQHEAEIARLKPLRWIKSIPAFAIAMQRDSPPTSTLWRDGSY